MHVLQHLSFYDALQGVSMLLKLTHDDHYLRYYRKVQNLLDGNHSHLVSYYNPLLHQLRKMIGIMGYLLVHVLILSDHDDHDIDRLLLHQMYFLIV